MFVNVGPAASNISESVDSLAYGDLVKNITNEKVSADADLEEQLRFLQVQCKTDKKGEAENADGDIAWASQKRARLAACSHGCRLSLCLCLSAVRAYEAKFGALDA